MGSFEPIGGRDAYATIAGFFYQFDLTILRWIELGPGQVLELERGEDIDIVAEALTQYSLGPGDWPRLLEQVKRRSENLTLRNPAAVSAIASFTQHQASYPDVDLFFRYTTTASPGHERGVSFPRGLSGVEAWQAIRNGRLGEDETAAAIADICRLLVDAKQPSHLAEDTWSAFSDFWGTAGDKEALEFIRRFEWASASEQPQALRRDIVRYLLEEGHASVEQEAADLYNRLLYYIVSRLSQSGLKQLTREELEDQLRKPTLSERDRERLNGVASWARIMALRVAVLEDQQRRLTAGQEQFEAARAEMEQRLSHMREDLGVGAEAAPRRGGAPPPSIATGEEYAELKPGIFITAHEQRAALFTAEREVGLLVALALYAGAVGRIGREFAWAQHGLGRAKATGQQVFLAELRRHMVPELTMKDRYDEAFAQGGRAGLTMAAANEFRREGRDVLTERFDVEKVLGPKPGERWNVAEHWALIHTVLPMSLRLALLSLVDQDAAKCHSGLVADLCRDFAADASDPEAWETASQLLETTYAYETDGEDELRGAARELFEARGPSVLPVVAYLGASLQPGVLPQRALLAHLTIVPMAQRLMSLQTLNRYLLWPIVAQYWQLKFEAMRFRFNHPRSLEPLIADAVASPEDYTVRRILRAIASDLRLRPSPQHMQWLNGGPPDEGLEFLYVD